MEDSNMIDESKGVDNSEMEEFKEMMTGKTTEIAEKDAAKYSNTPFRNQLGVYLTMDTVGRDIDLGATPYPVTEGDSLVSFGKIKERVMSTLTPAFVQFSE